MKKTLAITSIILTIICSFAHSASIDTVSVYSQVMKKNLKAVIVRPDRYNAAQELPVVYLLHGYSGNHADWITKAVGFQKAADIHNMIIVCPDGGFSSWYWDSPVDPQ